MNTTWQVLRWTNGSWVPFIFLFTNTGTAQPPQQRAFPDSSQVSAMVDTLAKRLSLSKEQKAKVQKVYFTAFEESKKSFEKNRGDFRAMREARMQITEKRDKEVKALLTEEQKKTYDKILQEQREQMQKRMDAWRRPD